MVVGGVGMSCHANCQQFMARRVARLICSATNATATFVMPGNLSVNSGPMGHAKDTKEIFACTVSSDRISSLPQEIKGYILSYLNVEEAIRASILSRTWRNVWTTMPVIRLCDSSFGSSEASPQIARSKFVTLADLTLSLHEGPLISVSIEGNRSYHDVFDRWMYMLSRNKPFYITIKLISGEKYKIPSSLFFITDLEHLTVKNCVISLPWDFDGFKCLTHLNLKLFSSTDSAINNLISSCPLLHSLCLKYFEGIRCLNIRAQVLYLLEVEGNFEDLHLFAPNLVHAYLTLDETEAHQSVQLKGGSKSYLKQAFGSLTRIKTLTVSNTFLMYLSKGCMLTKMPGVFDHLEKICIEGRLWTLTEIMAACSLFQNAPILSELDFWNYARAEDIMPKKMWDDDCVKIQAPTLDHLVTITLHDFMGFDCEVAFLGLLLSWAPALEELKIEISGRTTHHCICKAIIKLLALPRASAKAKVLLI
ncbi:hypothetical protein ACP70R_026889 [Stipagrostis hirtigluma subsp. patula]